MDDQASRRCMCGDTAAFCAWRIFLYPALSRCRWLPPRGFERRGLAEPKRKYSAILVLEIAVRAAATSRASGQGKCRATLSSFDCLEQPAGKRVLCPSRDARTETDLETGKNRGGRERTGLDLRT